MLAVLVYLAFQAPLDLTPFAVVKEPALGEISGIVKGTHNRFWVHNDSGDSARIFAINRDGTVVKPAGNDYQGIRFEGAKNVDWEDIAFGGGKLWISDLGNNGNARKDLGVYVTTEPDPMRTQVVTGAKFLPVTYPDQTAFPPQIKHFDCEAVFVFRGKLHVLTKHRMPNGQIPESGTNLYRLDTQFTNRSNVLKRLDGKEDMKGWVTAADFGANRYLAILTQFPKASIWIFDTANVGDKLLSKPVRWVELNNAKQCEAICFDGNDTVVVANEQRDIFRIPLEKIPKL